MVRRNKMYITDEELIQKGFSKYDRYAGQTDSIIYNFQKCYRDENNNRLFFIDINKWDFSWAKVPIGQEYTYEITAQLYRKGDHEFFDIRFGTNFTIEQAEEFIYKLLENNIIEPYER